MAAVLALKRHSAEPLDCPIPKDLDFRISKAVSFLQAHLEKWDVESSDHVGFEILVPNLLQMLEDGGFRFTVPGLPKLLSMRDKKLSKFDPQILYGQTKLTLLHSLEAFIGIIDFDRVGHHLQSGSMMASPASTAAYLMYSSSWNEEAEHYLSTVIAHSSGKAGGGVPSAFPTPIFELTWVLSTFLLSGFTKENLGLENLRIIRDYLENHLRTGDGTVGFAPGLLSDADDTAKAILSLNLIGKSTSPARMIAEFETTALFKTYTTERNPSFSANCNNLSVQYPMMLLAQALMRLLRLWDSKQLSNLPEAMVRDQIPVILFQILCRTLRSQESRGSWSSQSPEVSAYSVLTLIYLLPLPWASALKPEILTAISSGRNFLAQSRDRWTEPDHIWIEKVSYSSEVLCQLYCLAAMNSPIVEDHWQAPVSTLTSIPFTSVEKFVSFFIRLPLFSRESKWRLRASLMEGFLFLPRLQRISRDIFPREGMAKDKYLEYIPLTWTAINNQQKTPFSANFLQDMMEISMLNYQVDEYMEAIIGRHFEDNLGAVKEIIHSLCGEPRNEGEGINAQGSIDTTRISMNGTVRGHSNPTGSTGIFSIDTIKQNIGRLVYNILGQPATASTSAEKLTSSPVAINIDTVDQTLGRFVQRVLSDPKILKSSQNDQANLKRELKTFLLAHILHTEDNVRFSRQEFFQSSTVPFLSPGHAYHKWVHTTSADHTSCPYSFAFVICLTSNGPLDCFTEAYTKYLAQDLCSHLAAMCRQYNDYGSLKRDREERNLNSVNFPEFHGEPSNAVSKDKSSLSEEEIEAREQDIKAALFEIAEYERECLMSVMHKIDERVPIRVMNMLNLFVGITDLYGQIYVARDIASRIS
ncbi:hypothetical protein MMC11_008335 [Xylographa trunciseda]|nr:hypothetical protein [Xylographa trunciseda]